MQYFPMIASARPRRQYVFGEYEALLLDEIQSAQEVKYYFVLAVYRRQDKAPCYAVASEYSCRESKVAPFLGVFPGDGHLNMGNSPDWLVLDKFAAEAMRLTLSRLDVPSDLPIIVKEARTKPWWKFW